MARFEFRLEALLTHRRQTEKEAQRRVASIRREIQTQVEHIQATQASIHAENHTLGSRELTGRLDMAYIAHQKRFVGNLQVRLILALQKLSELEQALARERAGLLEAARARKVIEKLREKQFARWRAALERKESALFDEIATQLTRRGTAGSPLPEGPNAGVRS